MQGVPNPPVGWPPGLGLNHLNENGGSASDLLEVMKEEHEQNLPARTCCPVTKKGKYRSVKNTKKAETENIILENTCSCSDMSTGSGETGLLQCRGDEEESESLGLY